MAHCLLGNIAPVDKPTDPDTGLADPARLVHYDGQSTTVFEIPGADSDADAERNIMAIWASVSHRAPAWVEFPERPRVEAVLRARYGVDGRPEQWDHTVVRCDDPANHDDHLAALDRPATEG